jgi:SEC-C motif
MKGGTSDGKEALRRRVLLFEPMSKRRRGFPSETKVKRGDRAVRGGKKELIERLGNNDLCPCGSGRRFQALLPEQRPLLTA